jgi:hypothetical protein
MGLSHSKERNTISMTGYPYFLAPRVLAHNGIPAPRIWRLSAFLYIVDAYSSINYAYASSTDSSGGRENDLTPHSMGANDRFKESSLITNTILTKIKIYKKNLLSVLIALLNPVLLCPSKVKNS